MSDIVIIVILGMIILIWRSHKDMSVPKNKICDGPHKWEYDIDRNMYCKNCRIKPGADNE